MTVAFGEECSGSWVPDGSVTLGLEAGDKK